MRGIKIFTCQGRIDAKLRGVNFGSKVYNKAETQLLQTLFSIKPYRVTFSPQLQSQYFLHFKGLFPKSDRGDMII